MVTAVVDGYTVEVRQTLVFKNDSQDTLRSIVLNDWNNAYSGKDTPLAKRFSDEFVRSFYRAKDEERGYTSLHSVKNANDEILAWVRSKEHPDLIEIGTGQILPGQEITLSLLYDIKLPSDRFTGYGYDNRGNMRLKDCFLVPARYAEHRFARYSNSNLDDSANGISGYQITLFVPGSRKVVSDLEEEAQWASGMTAWLNQLSCGALEESA